MGYAAIGGSRTQATTSATSTFAEDASRIRNNPDIVARLRSFAYNLIRASGCENIHNARWRAALDLNLLHQNARNLCRTKQPWRPHPHRTCKCLQNHHNSIRLHRSCPSCKLLRRWSSPPFEPLIPQEGFCLGPIPKLTLIA